MTGPLGDAELPEEVLLTPEETARALHCTLNDLRRQRDQQQGPAYIDLGDGLIRYPRADVEHSMAQPQRLDDSDRER